MDTERVVIMGADGVTEVEITIDEQPDGFYVTTSLDADTPSPS